MRTELKENTLNFVTGGSFTATVTGTTNYLAVRTKPIYNQYNEIEGLHNGTKVTVLEAPSDSWYWLIQAPDGSVGYANKRFLQ